MSFIKINIFIVITLFGLLPLSAQVIADFNVSNTEACGSLQTNFYDQSTSSVGAIIDWQWDMGGITSQKQNPGVIFNEPGTYTICLTATDQAGNTGTICKEDLVIVRPNPIAAFSIDKNRGCSPLNIAFTNNSTSENGAIVSLLWDVGGSVNVYESFDPNEVINTNYNQGGVYSASLTIEDESGCKNTVFQQEIVEVFDIPQITLNYLVLSACTLPLQVEFINSNPNPQTTYHWDFGNGETFTGPIPPTIFYTEEASYDVIVTMESGGCTNTATFPDYINTQPNINFTVNPEPICLGSMATFTDISNSLVDSVFWDFGDGTTSTAFNPKHQYNSDGCFEVKLVRYNGVCTDSIINPCVKVLPVPDVTYNLDNQFSCDLPANVSLNAQSNGTGTYLWTFDITPDSLTGPSVMLQINEPGLHYANLNYIDNVGCDVIIDSIEIDVSLFEANLPIQKIGGCIPLDFTLGDSVLALVPIVSWQWTIGNPVIFTSSDPNPSFMVSDTGEYDVQLIVENIYGCIDTVFRPGYVQAGIPPVVDFTATPLDDCLAIERHFTDLSSPYADQWIWHFGEDGFSFDQNPEYVFPDPNIYDISLTAFHNGCGSSNLKPDYINVLKPRSGFAVDYNCEDPYTVSIHNTSVGADSLYWELVLSETQRDTILDSLFNTYTFPTTGYYSLSHYSKNDSTGCEHIYVDTIKIVDPIASYALDTLSGCAPITLLSSNYSIDADRYFFEASNASIDNDTLLTPLFTYNEGGVYEAPILYVTDIHECRDSFQLSDSIRINDIKANIFLPGSVCIPDTLQLVDDSRDTLGSIISWDWNINNGEETSGDQNPSFFISEEKQYTVSLKVEDDWGCQDSTVQVLYGVFLEPEFIGDTLSCTTHGILFTAIVNNPNVSGYHWTFGDGGTSDSNKPFYTYTTEGAYTVCLTIDDSRGCSVTKCKENFVTIKDPIASFNGDPLYDSCPPLLTNFNNLSENGILYNWTFGDISGNSNLSDPSHVYTSPGEFDVTLIAEMTSFCKDTLTLVDYVIVDGPTAEFSMEIDSSCTPLSMTMQATSDDFYTFIWDFGNGEIDSLEQEVMSDTVTFVYDVVGKYTPKLIVKDNQGCIRSFTGEDIFVNEFELGFLHTSEVLCDVPIALQLENLSSSTGINTTYEWQINGNAYYSSLENNPLFIIDSEGQYDVLLIGRSDNCIDSLIINESFEVGLSPDVSFELDADKLCEKLEVTFVNNTQIPYGEINEWHWDFGDGNESFDYEPTHAFDGLSTLNIVLTATTDVGCMGSFGLQSPVLPSVQVSVSDDALICLGDSLDLWAGLSEDFPGTTYSWNTDPTLSCTSCLSPNVNPVDTTTYYFSAIHSNGCTSLDSVIVSVAPIYGPQLQLSSDTTVCEGDTATINITNYSSTFSYHWDVDDQGLDCYLDCNQVKASPENSTYFSLIVYNQLGCFKEDSILVEVEKFIPDFLADQKFICEDSTTVLNITFGNDPIWLDPSIDCSGCMEVVVSPQTDQHYHVSVLSDAGCRYQDSILVNIVPTQSISVDEGEIICNGESISLSGSGIGSPQWMPSESLNNAFVLNPLASPSETTIYTLSMNKGECTLRDTVRIEVIYKVEIEAFGDTLCPEEIAQLEVVGFADSYRWYDQNNLVNEGLNFNLVLSETKEYMIIGHLGLCESDTAFARALVHPKIDLNLDNNYLIYSNNQVPVNITYDLNRNYSFNWFPVTGLSCTNCPDPIISEISMADTYTVTVVDEDSGCLLEEDIFVRYNRECTPEVFGIPNIFSPNNDGRNDAYFINTLNADEFIEMQIFDRWGEMVFQTEDIGVSWDGNLNGSFLSQGVYVVHIRAFCPETNEIYSFFKDVTLIR